VQAEAIAKIQAELNSRSSRGKKGKEKERTQAFPMLPRATSWTGETARVRESLDI